MGLARSDRSSVALREEEAVARRPPGRPRDEAATATIRAVALRQLGEVGFAGMTMEGVASAAGVARATIYRRYHDLADLVTSAICSNMDLPPPGTASKDPRADLIEFLVGMSERIGESGLDVIVSLLADNGGGGALQLHRTRIVAPRTAYARSLLLQAKARGELSPDVDVDLAIQMLGGSVFSRLISGSIPPPDWAERSVAMIWAPAAPA
jgi:hypothetical protein